MLACFQDDLGQFPDDFRRLQNPLRRPLLCLLFPALSTPGARRNTRSDEIRRPPLAVTSVFEIVEPSLNPPGEGFYAPRAFRPLGYDGGLWASTPSKQHSFFIVFKFFAA